MAFYLIQAKPTSEFWSHALSDPDIIRGQWVNIVVGRLGGKIHGLWASFGEFDVTLICELPDDMSAAALSLAYSAGGTMESVETTVLLTVEDAVTALRKASSDPGA
jgi:uncharacterized protein with GYD domain